MDNKPLLKYVKDTLKKGYSVSRIRDYLIKQGYKKGEVDSILKKAYSKKTVKAKSPGLGFGTKLRLYFYHINKPIRTFFSSPVNRLTSVFLGVLLILMVFLIALNRPTPPILYFVDEITGEFLSGDVYLDDEFIGETQGTFDKLPERYCRSKHILSLKINKVILKWNTSREDCELYKIPFTHNFTGLSTMEEKKGFIMMLFVMKDTEEPLRGSLFFDGEYITTINGKYAFSEEECLAIKNINLTNIDEIEQNYYEWQHNSDLCKYSIIKYVAPPLGDSS
jgi:hypothetical protein